MKSYQFINLFKSYQFINLFFSNLFMILVLYKGSHFYDISSHPLIFLFLIQCNLNLKNPMNEHDAANHLFVKSCTFSPQVNI